MKLRSLAVLRKADSRYLPILVLAGFIISLLSFGQMVAMQTLIEKRSDGWAALRVGLLMLVCSFAIEIVSTLLALRGELAAQLTQKMMTEAAVHKCENAKLNEFESKRWLDGLEFQQAGLLSVPLQVSGGIVSLLSGLGIIFGAIVSLISLGPMYSLGFALCMVPLVLASLASTSASISLSEGLVSIQRKVGYLTWLLTMREGQLTTRGSGLFLHIKKMLSTAFVSTISEVKNSLRSRVWLIVSGQIGSALILVLVLIGTKTLSSSETNMGVTIVALALLQVRGAGVSALSGFESIWAAEKLFALFPEQELKKSQSQRSGAATDASAGILLSKVSYTYPDAKTACLCEESLQIRPGQLVVIVGANGSGKSTLAKIAAGLLRPDRGMVVSLDNMTLRQGPAMCYEGVHLVQQDPLLMQIPIQTVLRCYEPLIWEKLRISELVESLPFGLDSELGRLDGSGELSAGQWQRVLLARALCSEDKVLILDEPTAFLDSCARKGFLSLLSQRSDRGYLVVTHDQEIVEMADCVLSLNLGAKNAVC